LAGEGDGAVYDVGVVEAGRVAVGVSAVDEVVPAAGLGALGEFAEDLVEVALEEGGVGEGTSGGRLKTGD
jgi:hypothetical protein